MPSRVRLAVVAALAAACVPRTADRARPGAAPDPERVRAEVAWLADPAREGRGIGTAGGAAAAAWIADRFREAGLAPAFDGGYAQRFEAPFRATLGERNALAIGDVAPALGAEWLPLGFSDDGAVEAEVVFAGYGIAAPDLGYDDYAGLDVKGKVVLVAQDFPREADPASPFRDPRNYRYGEWRTKAIAAREHGAAAMIGVRDVWAHPASPPLGGASDGADDLPPWRGQVASRAGLLAVRATAAALARAGVDVRALAAPLEADGRPHSRPLGRTARLSIEVRHERAETANVVAILPGSDPAVASECVVVGAHHDHLGLGGDASLAPDQVGTVHPGADDDASGVAALLEIGRALAAEGPRRRTVLLAAFAGEEIGLLGSAKLVADPPARCPVDRMQLMLNLDMVGRPRDGKLYVDGADTAKGLRALLPQLASRRPALPLRIAFGGDGYGPSDQTSFLARGVPVLFFFTGAHADYHRPTDTADKVDAAAVADVARLALRVVRDAADRPDRLEAVRVAGPPPPASERSERSYGTYLGAIPDFAERDAPGVLLTGVRPGSPAERAGLASGDVLLRVGTTRLVSLQDLAFALRSHRPGDEVEIEWQRGAERRTVRVRLEERRR
ncbi:MAG TPA: M20/M25/M40 family metallo-hydrolase [Anaeromyxobacter sp.]|nr:M20/M25/M40 family metallo-hydrolase [Anaeromyxobacter sp.]